MTRPLTAIARSAFVRLALSTLLLLPLAACGGNAGANIRDCSQWRTESIPGCYNGQGGGKV